MAQLSPLRRRMIEDMTVGNMSPATQRSYVSAVSKFRRYFGKSPERLYQEVEEQIVHADRLGYDCFAIVEHFFFPKFSVSANPTARFYSSHCRVP